MLLDAISNDFFKESLRIHYYSFYVYPKASIKRCLPPYMSTDPRVTSSLVYSPRLRLSPLNIRHGDVYVGVITKRFYNYLNMDRNYIFLISKSSSLNRK